MLKLRIVIMTNEPNQTDADESETTPDDPVEGASATAPSPAAADADEEPSSVPPPTETSDEEIEAEAADTDETDEEDQGLGEETSEPGLAADTSDVGLDEESSEVETEDAEETDDQPADADEAEDDEDEEVDESLDLPEFDNLGEQGAEWLAGLFDRMHFEADGEVFEEEGEPRVDISGPDADRLLGAGKLGPKAIEGIETLMQSVFSEDDTASDLYVDVGNQRAERKEMLQRVAVDLADRSVDLHKSVTVSGLNSTERRIIHRRLRDYDGVDTESVGDGIFRRLKIEPTG